MKLYFAAAESALKELASVNCSNILISMANGEKKIPLVPSHFSKYNLIIDSGAFTYYKKGGIELSKWIEKAGKLIVPNSELIGLDVIGNAEESFKNYQIIKNVFPSAIPTFHVGSDTKYLFEYLKSTNRIAIGGMVPYKSEIETLKKYLNEIFKNFSLESMPKFHAFGYFSPNVLENYPFYSADASTWQNYSRFGEFHKFEKAEYLRMKSLNVEKFNPINLSINDLYVYSKNDSELKLKSIAEAVKKYEFYLTYLWKTRGVNFQ